MNETPLATLPNGSAEDVALAIKAQSELNFLMHEAQFTHLQRVAAMFSSSHMVPERFQTYTFIDDDGVEQKHERRADASIVLAMAWRHHSDPMAFFNGVYIIKGRPAMEAKLAIALVNQAGVFKGRIRYELSGDKKDRSCRAYATLADTGDVVDMTVDMDMARAEGWTKNTKWTSMQDLMLMYRSAMFLIRVYEPGTLFGMTTKDEADEMNARPIHIEVTGEDLASKIDAKRRELPPAAPVSETVDGGMRVVTPEEETVEDPEPEAGPEPATPATPTIEAIPENTTVTVAAADPFLLTGETVDEETGEVGKEEPPPAEPPKQTKTTAKAASAVADRQAKGQYTAAEVKAERQAAATKYIELTESYNVPRKNIRNMPTMSIHAEIARIIKEGRK